jgi:hypothetical protein
MMGLGLKKGQSVGSFPLTEYFDLIWLAIIKEYPTVPSSGFGPVPPHYDCSFSQGRDWMASTEHNESD